ncbi:MAG: prolipoprotein diacylglyceryl transferase [Nanoarchaeota archaeon]|nr:prolipoprotein diacylglyceryl transferase [Nanoarchaeota archaeon]
MFYNNIDPVLFHLGPFEVRYYGIVYVLGFILAFLVLDYYRKRGDLKLSRDDLYDLLIYLILGVLIGSRLVHIIFWEPAYYLAHPLDILKFWNGGMAFHGGLLGIIVGAWLFCRQKKVSMWKIADILAAPATLMLAFGRLANFTNSELYGTPTNVGWCVMFQNVEGCRHPYQIYSFLKRMAVFGWLMFLAVNKSAKRFKEGFIFWNMVVWMDLGRFILDFWRVDARYFGLTMGQYLGLLLFVVGAVVLLKYYRNDLKKLFIWI